MYIDIYYIILVLPALILSVYAQMKVSSAFSKYSRLGSMRGFTGAEVARKLLDLNGLTNVTIERVNGNLTDHYDPSKRVVRLSESVYSSTSVAAVSVAAHETGHAVQHGTNYAPLKIRSAVFPVVSFSSQIAIPLAVIGFIFSLQSLVNLVITLPVECNASARALNMLDNTGVLSPDEIKASRKVLTAAALTYLAAALTAAANLLRLILLNNRRR